MQLFIIIFISFIFGYILACILYISKQASEKENIELNSSEETYEQKEIKQLQISLKNEQLKSAYYITVINQIEEELKNQQFNSIINLINRIRTIISPEDNYNIQKRKELIKTATNEKWLVQQYTHYLFMHTSFIIITYILIFCKRSGKEKKQWII